MTIEQNKACGAIAKHFGYPAKHGVDQGKQSLTSEDAGVVEIQYPGADTVRFGSSKADLRLGDLFFWKKLEKSQLFSDYSDLVENYAVDFMVFTSGSTLAVMYAGERYEGFGGIFVRPENERMGVVISTLQSYLREKYPVANNDL